MTQHDRGAEKPRDPRALRREPAPEPFDAFRAFNAAVFRPGALDVKTKELIALAVAHVTQCERCIQGHTRQLRKLGATKSELMEAIWVAAETRAGGTYAHALVALEAWDD